MSISHPDEYLDLIIIDFNDILFCPKSFFQKSTTPIGPFLF
ncbi:hypothetical protein AQPE_2588 [Aquipluma nitroreducens]|uniref:Uncharacterized protein n=1 Tax=Aquipluma nitroreducens TaxID=2010828 RepID=A0A5K7SAD6_9BACT|nr:hypothetical protein AQPE_2588 [Aquipluma nitroreducens]